MATKFIRAIPLDPSSKVSKSAVHLSDARTALTRGVDARNEAQVLDSINSAQLFIKLAKSALDSTPEAKLKVTTDNFGRSKVDYTE